MKRSKLDDQESIAFQFHQALEYAVKDLESIDKLIPRESSRIAMKDMDEEAWYIINARKTDLLRYIQTICRDHMHWGKKLLDSGWTVEQQQRAKRKRSR